MDMARRRIDLRLDEDLLARLDAEAERLGQTRTKFIERALESALGPESQDAPGAGVVRPAASSRASAKKVEVALEARDAVRARSAAAPVPGVRPAREFVLDPRQARLNKAKES